MKYNLCVVQVAEIEQEIAVPKDLFLLVVRYTNMDGSQFIRRVVTDDYRGNIPRSVYKNVKVLQAFEYSKSGEIPSYDVYGISDIEEIGQ